MKVSEKTLAHVCIGTSLLCGVLSAMPVGAGYSNAVSLKKADGDFATVGIVTQISGKVYKLSKNAGTAEEKKPIVLEDRSTIVVSNRVWADENSLVTVMNTGGGQFVVSGPAVVEFTANNKIKVLSGSAKVICMDGSSQYFDSTYMSGMLTGVGSEAAVWSSEHLTQVMGIEGDTRAWHPHLNEAVVAVKAGYFAESSAKFKYLQPKKPQEIDIELAKISVSFV